MRSNDQKEIDIVIAWVDGDDPALKQKRAQYQKTTSAASDAVSSTRFASNDEIYYNIASILKYVPFCRYIYVVTDQQRPALIDEFANQGICDKDKIRIVDHKDIFSGAHQCLRLDFEVAWIIDLAHVDSSLHDLVNWAGFSGNGAPCRRIE